MKPAHVYIFLLLAILPLSPACLKKAEQTTGSLEIVFKATFGAEPLYMFARSYDYRADAAVKWQSFQFYLSHLELQSATEAAVRRELSPVELINFSDIQNESDARKGFSLIFDQLETGSYNQLKFGLGVSPELNATRPSNYRPAEPLAQVSNYWEAASSYIYAKIEGNADLDQDGQYGEEPEKITYHLGATELFAERVLPVSVEIRENSVTQLVIYVDLRKALENEAQGTFIDFRQTPRDHHKNPDVYTFILNQLRESAISTGH